MPSFSVSTLHPALDWAKPLVEYAFAKSGRVAVLTAVRVGDPAGAYRMEFGLRDPITKGPYFGPAVLETLVEETACALNFLSDSGPGGRFEVRVKFQDLRVEWLEA